MSLPGSGALSLSQIQTEFGGSNPVSLTEYYAGGANVPSGTGDIPTSGAISVTEFYGTSDIITVAWSITGGGAGGTAGFVPGSYKSASGGNGGGAGGLATGTQGGFSKGDTISFVIGGGAGTYNPEPIAPFFDAFLLGDGEEAILEIMDTVRCSRERGASREQTLLELARVPGMYVPSHFSIDYDGINISSIEAHEGTPGSETMTKHGTPRVARRTVLDLDAAPYPTKPIIPNVKPIHDRVSIEVQRGCSQGCRFCQAGISV